MLKTVEYNEGVLTVLDQTQLPSSRCYETLPTLECVFDAIRTLKVRGAPLIGVVAAYGIVAEAIRHRNDEDLLMIVERSCEFLKGARPTAVNLSWALDRMLAVASGYTSVDSGDNEALILALEQEARRIEAEDTSINRRIGEQTYPLIKDLIKDNRITILTHCNAGALGTTGYGTATSVMYLLKEQGVDVKVYACETRPLLQGSRLTAFELSQAKIDVTLITDSMVATVMASGLIDFVIVGADRVAANLDTANKIGTLGISIIAQFYGVPFYVCCPGPTFDENTAQGCDIIIEEREGKEITQLKGVHLAPDNIETFNPAFDVTPADLITAVITENGILEKR